MEIFDRKQGACKWHPGERGGPGYYSLCTQERVELGGDREKLTVLPPSSFGLPRAGHKGGGEERASPPQAGAATAAVMMPWLPNNAASISSKAPERAVTPRYLPPH